MEKKENNNKINKKAIYGALAVAVCLLIIAGVMLIFFGGNDKKVPKKNDSGDDKPEVSIKTYTEQQIIDDYGMSIKDAEELVMEYYHSDNFECSTEIVEAHYVVTVTETFSGDKYVYTVNPATHEYTRDK